MENNIQGSLERRKQRRRLLLLGFLAALAALVLYAVSRPSEKTQEQRQLRQDMVSVMRAGGGGPGQMMDIFTGSSDGGVDPQKLKTLREAMGKMSETERRQLVRDSLKSYLDVARKETANLDEKQVKNMVQKMVLDVRGRFSSLSPKQREEAGKALSSPAGKKQLQENLDFYFNDFSAKEQEMMLPLVREVLINMDAL